MIISTIKFVGLLITKAAKSNGVFHGLLFGPREELKALRIFVSALYGSLIGLALYKYILFPIGSPTRLRIIVAGVLCLCCALMCALSARFRCVSVLMWSEGLGKAGRAFIKALVFALILAGPVNNIILNTRESVRVLECTSYLAYNLTKTRVSLAVKPFTNAFMYVNANFSDVKAKFNEVEHVIGPIIHEIEQQTSRTINKRDAGEHFTSLYEKKLVKRCEAVLESGKKKCEAAFDQIYQSCLQKTPPQVASLICWPLKIDFICGIQNVFSNGIVNVCDPSNVIDASFGADYVRAKEIASNLTMHYGNVAINYKPSNVKELNVIKSINTTSRRIGRHFEAKASIIERVFHYVHRLAILVYFKVIYDAIKFHDDYLDEIEFNNFYITNYFKKIDRRRVIAGRSSVLPIKQSESKKLVDPESARTSRRESEGYLGSSLRLTLQLISTTVVVCLDRLFFELLEIIARHSRVNYLQEGVHNLNITLNGSGFIANLIRASIEGFNIDEHIKVAMTNEPCLPRPVLIQPFLIIRIYLLLLLYLYLIYNQTYIHRSKRSVCAFFYPKREKTRVLYLYNKLLRSRKNIVDLMLQTLQRKLKAHSGLSQETNFCQRMLRSFPRLCKCLWCFSFARPRCFICNETQAREMTKDSIYYLQCQKGKCRIIYCEQCWLEMGRRCLACRYRRKCGEERGKGNCSRC